MSTDSLLSCHIPVLMEESLFWLSPQPGQILADGTLGGGGHTRAMANLVGDSGRVVAVDQDPGAIARAEQNLKGMPVMLAQANFTDLPEVIVEAGFEYVHGILLDLGLSSDQLADNSRGFSFQLDGPLDLRFDPTQGKPAWHLLERLSAEHLADLIYQYGEERYSRRIARAICETRQHTPIRTSGQLAQLVRRALPPSAKLGRIDPATRTFQALRIAVNHELRSLEMGLKRLPDLLYPGGRLAIISFHSLEDRLVKTAFRHDPRLKALTAKPICPSEREEIQNPRSRSARLRIAERVFEEVPPCIQS